MPGHLAVPPALHFPLHHWTLLLHRQHLLLHISGLPGGVVPQPAPGVPLLEETPCLQGALRGSARLCPGQAVLHPCPFLAACTHLLKTLSLWSSERKFCSWNGFGFSQRAPRWCQGASARGEQPPAQFPTGQGLPTNALSVLGGSPRPSSDLDSWGHPGDPSPLTLPLVLPSPLRVHLGCPMRLTVPLGAAWESLCAPQDIPPSSWCLSGHPRESPLAFWCSLCVPFSLLLGPFGAPCTLQ